MRLGSSEQGWSEIGYYYKHPDQNKWDGSVSDPRKHHYLPQFYLEGFKIDPQVTKKPHIWQIEKEGNQNHYSAAIDSTGCIRDFHTLDVKDQDSDHKAIEAVLSRIETEQAALVRAIRRAGKVKPELVEQLAAFLSLMRHPVPAFARHIEEFLRSTVTDVFKAMYRSGRFGEPPEALHALIERKGIDNALRFKISNWKILKQMFEMAFSAEIVDILARMNYRLYTNPNRNFVTSDNPVALFHPNYDEIRPYGVGPAMKGVEITIPLSCDTLVLGRWESQTGASIATDEQVAEFNRRTIVMAERYVFANSVPARLRQMIGAHKGIRAGFVFDNLPHGTGSYYVMRFIPVC